MEGRSLSSVQLGDEDAAGFLYSVFPLRIFRWCLGRGHLGVRMSLGGVKGVPSAKSPGESLVSGNTGRGWWWWWS